MGRASNGAEAVKHFTTLRPDLVLLDIMMPVMDGLQALRMILQLDKDAKVIMTTSVAGVGEKASEAFRLGACAIISKPFEAADIAKTIDSV